jgi:hypothetical protein
VFRVAQQVGGSVIEQELLRIVRRGVMEALEEMRSGAGALADLLRREEEPERPLTLDESAAFAELTGRTLRNWVAIGRLVPFSRKPLRFERAELLRAMRAGAPQGKRGAPKGEALAERLLQK